VTRQREQLKEKLGQITLKKKKCIDWGSGAKPAARYVQHSDCKWLCVDKNPDIVDNYRNWKLTYKVADIESLQYKPTYDVAFCLEVLEHTLYPRIVVSNIYGSLKKGGVLYLSVPFLFPIHAEEDYWRFTEHGLRHLLKEFSSVSIVSFEEECGYWVRAVK
jgi:2-polyprenyl-3-methyl-5-hydroxy-6-metoxy-1,4-benzoquinol methylase